MWFVDIALPGFVRKCWSSVQEDDAVEGYLPGIEK
jgi:hypothetical protein